MLVSNSAGYKVFCETKQIDVLPGHYHIRVYTTFDQSKDPDYQQSKFSDAEINYGQTTGLLNSTTGKYLVYGAIGLGLLLMIKK